MAELKYNVSVDNIERYCTIGFAKRLNGKEIRVKAEGAEHAQVLQLFAHFAKYFENETVEISSGETITFGCWLLKLVETEIGWLDVLEMNAAGTEFVMGSKFALKIFGTQVMRCVNHASVFRPPLPSSKVAISDGVLEGMKVQGARHKMPPHMSGWIISTDLYDGDAKSLRLFDLGELIISRLDLVGFLALDYGFRFNLEGEKEEVRFDSAIL